MPHSSKCTRKVTIFGSARPPANNHYYKQTVELARESGTPVRRKPEELYDNGYAATQKFLSTWDWPAYLSRFR